MAVGKSKNPLRGHIRRSRKRADNPLRGHIERQLQKGLSTYSELIGEMEQAQGMNLPDISQAWHEQAFGGMEFQPGPGAEAALAGLPPEPLQMRAAIGLETQEYKPIVGSPGSTLGRISQSIEKSASESLFAPQELREAMEDIPPGEGFAGGAASFGMGLADYVPAIAVPQLLPIIFGKHGMERARNTFEQTGNAGAAMGAGILSILGEAGLIAVAGGFGPAIQKQFGNLILRGQYNAAAKIIASGGKAGAGAGTVAAIENALQEMNLAGFGEQTFTDALANIKETTPEAALHGAATGVFIAGGAALHGLIKTASGRTKIRREVQRAYKEGNTDQIAMAREFAESQGIPPELLGIKPIKEAPPAEIGKKGPNMDRFTKEAPQAPETPPAALEPKPAQPPKEAKPVTEAKPVEPVVEVVPEQIPSKPWEMTHAQLEKSLMKDVPRPLTPAIRYGESEYRATGDQLIHNEILRQVKELGDKDFDANKLQYGYILPDGRFVEFSRETLDTPIISKEDHKKIVQQAVSEGKAVPEEVLADISFVGVAGEVEVIPEQIPTIVGISQPKPQRSSGLYVRTQEGTQEVADQASPPGLQPLRRIPVEKGLEKDIHPSFQKDTTETGEVKKPWLLTEKDFYKRYQGKWKPGVMTDDGKFITGWDHGNALNRAEDAGHPVSKESLGQMAGWKVAGEIILDKDFPEGNPDQLHEAIVARAIREGKIDSHPDYPGLSSLGGGVEVGAVAPTSVQPEPDASTIQISEQKPALPTPKIQSLSRRTSKLEPVDMPATLEGIKSSIREETRTMGFLERLRKCLGAK